MKTVISIIGALLAVAFGAAGELWSIGRMVNTDEHPAWLLLRMPVTIAWILIFGWLGARLIMWRWPI